MRVRAFTHTVQERTTAGMLHEYVHIHVSECNAWFTRVWCMVQYLIRLNKQPWTLFHEFSTKDNLIV